MTDGNNQEVQSGISEKSTVAGENEVGREGKIPKDEDAKAKVSKRSSSKNVAQNVVNSSLPYLVFMCRVHSSKLLVIENMVQ